jgi:outer membrane assembly lipoprotein YfiO
MEKLIVLFLIFLTGCFSEHDFVAQEHYFDQSDDALMTEAETLFNQKNYQSARKVLENFGTLYPLSQKSSFAELLLIECYFHEDDYPMLKAASDRFIYEQPQDKSIDRVKFLRLVANIKQAYGYPYEWLPIDHAKRDVSKFKESFFEAQSFLKDHPNSQYADDILKKIPELKSMIARYYWLRGEDLYGRDQYIGAIQAYQIILDHYQDTEYAEKSLNKIQSFEKTFSNLKEINLQ